MKGYKLIHRSAIVASEEMTTIRDMARFFRVVRDYGMEHVVFLRMYFALCMGSIRFISELDRLLRAVEEMKGTLTESRDDAEELCFFRSS